MSDSAGRGRPTDFRIQPITEPDDELAEILAGTLVRDGKPLNIFGVLGHHPDLLKRFNRFAGWILNRGVVPPREKEVVILRIGWNAQAIYEFGQHTIIGRDRGLSDREIWALTQPVDAHPWSDKDRALIALADDLAADDCASDETWQALSVDWDDDGLIELVVTAGMYRLVSGFLNSTGVQLDEGVPGWPDEPAD
ncbi:MAG: carboxymuconolactone decarboxylase family protein [Actinomycetota bacterium]